MELLPDVLFPLLRSGCGRRDDCGNHGANCHKGQDQMGQPTGSRLATDCITLLPVLMLLGGCASHLPEPVPCEIEGLRNCMQAGDLLFAGLPSREALALLAERGYRTVLNTRGLEELAWNEAAVVEPLGMTYVSIPMPYPIHAISDDQVARFAELLEKGNCPSGASVREVLDFGR